ncbi:MAG: YchJ family protein [Microbacteriaceae bacterium]
MKSPTRNAQCPCDPAEVYRSCCGPFHSGSALALTAERLMRSRYSAYVVGDSRYLLATWHPSTRPRSLDLTADAGWRGLTILGTRKGGLLDNRGTVEFEAVYAGGSQHENSTFVKEDGFWFYVAAL